MDIDAYRNSAEVFLAELTREYYRHYAGLEDTYELEPIYARHGELFQREAIEHLRERADRAPAGSQDARARRMLLDFAVEGFLGQATKELESELARREASMSLASSPGSEEQIGFRESAALQANEPDADRRAWIEQQRFALMAEHLNPLYREIVESRHDTARALGFGSYRELCERCKALDLTELNAQTGAFSAWTERSYPKLLEPELQRVLGFGLRELRRSDLPRLFRAPGEDEHFPAARLVPSLIETARGLGLDLEAQAGVVLDVDSRPNKSPRAFCAPVRIPGEVYLVIAPVGGRDDYSALFHEAGHTEHAAHVDPSLPFEFRYLGDNAITEAFAFLLQHLVEDPHWLSRRLGVRDPERLVAAARAVRFVYLRRYAGKLAYELELHGAGGLRFDALAERYAELLSHAVGVPWARETFLADVDPGFYCSCYLRAWALETHLRAHLRERFGTAWFESPEAGAALRELWRDGQRLRPEELLLELSGARLDFAAVLDDLELAGTG
jgi:hypothetical protein